ncbi:MAG: LPS export ABC transporter permease LptG [Gammaproteobacteria bacterium]|nr:LPS export ABC transporter permease LptG [Gammaproteobacteria bacterium]
MKLLDRYISKTIVLATTVVGLVFLGVFSLLMMLGELKNIGEGDYGLWQAMFYVLLRMPNELYQFSPMLILLGSIIGLSILSSHKELAIMRTSGYSIRQMIKTTLLAVGGLTLVMAILGEGIAPFLNYKAAVQKENAKNAGIAVVTASGVWLHVDNNFVHIERVVGRQLLEGITRYEFDSQHRLLNTYHAKKLAYEHKQWRMYDVVQTHFYDQRTQSEMYENALWRLKINPTLLNIGLLDAKEMSLAKLAKFSHYLKQNGLQAAGYQYEFWRRAFQPLAALLMVFLAIPFVLATFSTATMGWRIVVGILVGFAFFITNATLGELCIVYQLPSQVAALLPLFVFAMLGFILSKSLIQR